MPVPKSLASLPAMRLSRIEILMSRKGIDLSDLVTRAKRSNVKSHKLVAYAFSRSGNLISSAVNARSADGLCSPFSIHAEEALIGKLRRLAARERFGNIEVLVIRNGKRDGPTMAKPCDRCMILMRNYGVKSIGYTDYDGKVRRI